jgi:STAS-like domain of unknown function (DUF4325)
MIIPVNKFGDILVSRPAGREHALIMRSSFRPATKDEPVELDFAGVRVVAPSWLDEVLRSLREEYGARVRCVPAPNASLVQSLKSLEELPAEPET